MLSESKVHPDLVQSIILSKVKRPNPGIVQTYLGYTLDWIWIGYPEIIQPTILQEHRATLQDFNLELGD